MRRSATLFITLPGICAILTGGQAFGQSVLSFHHPVAPGIIHEQFLLPGPNIVNVLEVELSNPLIEFESTRPDGLVKTTTQASAIDRIGHRVVGSINADFFSFETHWPDGNQVVNGVLAHGTRSGCSHLAIDRGKRAFIERLAFRGRVWAKDGTSDTISQVNNNRAAGTIAFYSPFRGVSTRTDSTGTECLIRLLDSASAGDTLHALVAGIARGNMTIPAAGGVISAAPGDHAAFLQSQLHVGDTIRIFLGFDVPLHSVRQVISGRGRFLAGGRNVTDSMSVLEGITPRFTGVRHPRTFAGFNADTSRLYLCTVDGRQPSSIGMTFGDMAGFMFLIGVTEAFNFDGGGSTTMVVRGEIANSPSDATGERRVANAFHVISTATDSAMYFLPAVRVVREPFSGNPRSVNAERSSQDTSRLRLPVPQRR